MHKLCALLGLPVLELEGGTQIGEVREVVVGPEGAAFVGVVIGSSSWLDRERGVLFADLYAIGRDALTVRDSGAVQDFAPVLAAPGAERLSTLCDKAVYTETGEFLGRVADLAFDAVTGEVRFYELSNGVITDLLSGRRLMPLPVAQVENADRLIVPVAMAGTLTAAEQDAGGVM